MKPDRAGDAGHRGSQELLLRVAWYYYQDELTQDEIARRLSVSRASVGRLLDRARKTGLVSISLNARHLDAFELSSDLCRAFGLAEALVVPDHEREPADHHALNARVGLGGAQFMSTRLRPGGSLGVGWGETVARVISAVSGGADGPPRVITLTGGVAGYLPAVLPARAVRGRAARARSSGGLPATVIPSPLAASTPALAEALRAEPAIAQAIAQAREVQHALVGVGTTAGATVSQPGYLSPEDVRGLREQRVVGEMLGQFFDADGNVADLPVHARRIGVGLPDLAHVPMVVGVAGGVHKAQAILGALHGGYLDVLVTNELAARRLLELARRRPARR